MARAETTNDAWIPLHSPEDPTAPLPLSGRLGRALLDGLPDVRRLIVFFLIVASTVLFKCRHASSVIHPLIRYQIYRNGVRLLPMVGLMALALGFIVVGQMIGLFSRVGAHEYAGTTMVIVVVREMGPLVTAMLLLSRVSTATVIDLATLRAQGRVEALEALGIDPVHYLVVPRVIGLGIAMASLTVYFILLTLGFAYLFAFLEDLPLSPEAFVNQVVAALRWEDFLLVALKTLFFGAVIGIIACYEGLARPQHLNEISRAARRAVARSILLCVLIDVLFILYLLV